MANSSPTCPNSTTVEFSLSNANAADVLDALWIEDAFSASPWPLPCFKALLVVARRKRIGHASPAIPLTETREPGSMLLIDCGRDEGYIEQKLALLSSGPLWVHEIKFDGYRMAARITPGKQSSSSPVPGSTGPPNIPQPPPP